MTLDSLSSSLIGKCFLSENAAMLCSFSYMNYFISIESSTISDAFDFYSESIINEFPSENSLTSSTSYHLTLAIFLALFKLSAIYRSSNRFTIIR